MSLTFPNSSRSYDETEQRIRFLGYDGMFQISFTVTVDALSKGKFGVAEAEARYLSAFDAARKHIQDIASKAYARTRKSSYALTAADV
jgi:hypothetical protein